MTEERHKQRNAEAIRRISKNMSKTINKREKGIQGIQRFCFQRWIEQRSKMRNKKYTANCIEIIFIFN